MENIKKLVQWIRSGRACQTCRNTGLVLKHRPIIYCTDDADEIMDAYRMASGPCPDCPNFEQASKEIEELYEANNLHHT